MTMTAQASSALMTSKEVAQYLHVSQASVSRWRTDGIGPDVVNLGTLNKPLFRYFRADLDTWLKSQKVRYR